MRVLAVAVAAVLLLIALPVSAQSTDPAVPSASVTQRVAPAPQAVARVQQAVRQEACGAKQHRKADGTLWRCTFADDFDGKRLDRRKWQAVKTRTSGYTSGNDCFRGGRDNVRVNDGKLRLTIRKLRKPITCRVPRAANFRTRYTAGSVTTHDIFSQTYGRFEVRAKFPSSRVKGLQSAIWMTPQTPIYGAWPRSGEIDIVEHYTHRPRRGIPYLHYAYGFPATPLTSQTNNHCMIAGKKQRQRFHRYVTEWEPGRIRIRIDGDICVDHKVQPGLPWLTPQPFNHPFVLNLTHLLGVKQNAFDPARTQLPSTFVVDHWRVWQ